VTSALRLRTGYLDQFRHLLKPDASKSGGVVPVSHSLAKAGNTTFLPTLFIPSESQAKTPPGMAGPITPFRCRI